MKFSKWLKERSLQEDFKKFDLEKQAAISSELAKSVNKPNSAAIARQVVNNPKVIKAASGMPGVKPDENRIKLDIDNAIKMQQKNDKMQQFGQRGMI